MSRFFRLSVIVSLAYSLIPSATCQSTNSIISILNDTNALKNFELVLMFQKTNFTNGERIICMAGLTNVSDSPTIMIQSYLGLNLRFLVTNSDGVAISPRDLDYSAGPHNSPELILPHSVERSCFPFPLNDYFRLGPGGYRISVVREMGHPFEDIIYTSKPVTITVIEAAPPTLTNAPVPTTK